MSPRLTDMVREMFSDGPRPLRLTREEEDLAVLLRGNDRLHNALKALIHSRLEGLAHVPEPTDPNACKSMLARDRELRVFLGLLDRLYRSVSVTGTAVGEPPA